MIRKIDQTLTKRTGKNVGSFKSAQRRSYGERSFSYHIDGIERDVHYSNKIEDWRMKMVASFRVESCAPIILVAARHEPDRWTVVDGYTCIVDQVYVQLDSLQCNECMRWSFRNWSRKRAGCSDGARYRLNCHPLWATKHWTIIQATINSLLSARDGLDTNFFTNAGNIVVRLRNLSKMLWMLLSYLSVTYVLCISNWVVTRKFFLALSLHTTSCEHYCRYTGISLYRRADTR